MKEELRSILYHFYEDVEIGVDGNYYYCDCDDDKTIDFVRVDNRLTIMESVNISDYDLYQIGLYL